MLFLYPRPCATTAGSSDAASSDRRTLLTRTSGLVVKLNQVEYRVQPTPAPTAARRG